MAFAPVQLEDAVTRRLFQPRCAHARALARSVVACGGAAAAVLLGALPAVAVEAPSGVAGPSGLTMLQNVLLFVVLPLALFVVISLLAVAPGALRKPRYRPGRPWSQEPTWFAGPEDPERAVQAAGPSREEKGGASGSW